MQATQRTPRFLKCGDKIRRFTILERLGVGGMAVVYVAHDPRWKAKVAIKLAQPELSDPCAQKRRWSEAEALARLSHPNVVAIYEVGLFEGQVFIAEEFVDGCDLEAWLHIEERTLQEIIGIFLQAGRGLAAAHAARLVHRDFKPSNVLVGKDGRARVADFDLARDTDEPPTASGPEPPAGLAKATALHKISGRLTQTGALLGTPRYMPPEQFHGEPLDERSDQFSYCVSLYEAVCGVRPFPGESFKKLKQRICSGDIEPPAKGKELPTWLASILERGLSVARQDRYPSLDALLEALQTHLG